jgi:Undecaprenyl-phosphate galactose phosphotransferase WbaP
MLATSTTTAATPEVEVRPDARLEDFRCPTWGRLTAWTIAAADLICLGLSAAVGLILVGLTNAGTELFSMLLVSPFLFMLAFAAIGLYPGIAMHASEELRRTTLTITLIFVTFFMLSMLSPSIPVVPYGVLITVWFLSVVTIPAGRGMARKWFCHRPWWGFPVVVIGSGEATRHVTWRLRGKPGMGLRPVAVLQDPNDPALAIDGVPVFRKPELAVDLHDRHGIQYGILIPRESCTAAEALDTFERYGKIFRHLIIVPDLVNTPIMGMVGRNLGGVLGFEVQQQLLQARPRICKRLMDLGMVLAGCVLALPLIAVVTVILKMSYRGGVFYGHTRIGQGGKRFTAWKFRTMVKDADQALEQHLELHPEQRIEWETDRKLKDDPRTTKLGRLLRKTSLDELPQLWNVLRGDMSIVGPRPIVQDEKKKYEDRFPLYGKIKPGLTGLWQVSGRTDLSFEERVDLDCYYSRNWSIWLDLYILAKTVWVVTMGKGAY